MAGNGRALLCAEMAPNLRAFACLSSASLFRGSLLPPQGLLLRTLHCPHRGLHWTCGHVFTSTHPVSWVMICPVHWSAPRSGAGGHRAPPLPPMTSLASSSSTELGPNLQLPLETMERVTGREPQGLSNPPRDPVTGSILEPNADTTITWPRSSAPEHPPCSLCMFPGLHLGGSHTTWASVGPHRAPGLLAPFHPSPPCLAGLLMTTSRSPRPQLYLMATRPTSCKKGQGRDIHLP